MRNIWPTESIHGIGSRLGPSRAWQCVGASEGRRNQAFALIALCAETAAGVPNSADHCSETVLQISSKISPDTVHDTYMPWPWTFTHLTAHMYLLSTTLLHTCTRARFAARARREKEGSMERCWRDTGVSVVHYDQNGQSGALEIQKEVW